MDKVGIRMDFIFEVGRLRVSFTKGPFKSSLGWVKASSGWEMIVEILLYSTLCYQILRNVLPKLVHCLDLDLNGKKTRRNFWRVPGMLGTYSVSYRNFSHHSTLLLLFFRLSYGMSATTQFDLDLTQFHMSLSLFFVLQEMFWSCLWVESSACL